MALLDGLDGIVGQIISGVIPGKESTYPHSYDVFPQDLSPQGHIVKFSAYTGGTVGSGWIPNTAGSSGTPNQKAYDALLYVPGGGGQGASGISYMDEHEYVDVKLTNPVSSRYLGVAITGGIARRAINPGIQVIYRSTNLRRFVFSFLFAPASQQEAQSMYNIVHQMRRFAAPDLANSLLFVTPAEWEIVFYFNGQENTTIPRIKRCALQRVMADYASQGEWSTFADGSPVACLLTLEFEEMEIIHRKYVEDGF